MRYYIVGSMIRFGPLAAFVPPNVNDLGHPLVFKIHEQSRGRGEEAHLVNLLEDAPHVPSKRAMLQLTAKDPVTQTKFFILPYQLFMTHVLGLGPMDDMLRHHGDLDGTAFLDGRAANLCNGACCSAACAHFPLEEQGRRSIHGHCVLIFNNGQSLQWLRDVLNGSSTEGRQRLREWRAPVIASIESMQTTCVASLPMLLVRHPEDVGFDFVGPPYSAKDCESDQFEGKLEGDVRDTNKRQRTMALQDPLPMDAAYNVALDDPNFLGRSRKDLPQTGRVLSRWPAYVRSPQRHVGCQHAECLRKQALASALQSDPA